MTLKWISVFVGVVMAAGCATTSPDVRFSRALQLQRKSRHDEALHVYRSILRDDQQQDGVICNIGLIHLDKKRFHEAAEYFRWALVINENNLGGRYLFAQALLREGKRYEALAQVTQLKRQRDTWRRNFVSRHGVVNSNVPLPGVHIPNFDSRVEQLNEQTQRGEISSGHSDNVMFLARYVH